MIWLGNTTMRQSDHDGQAGIECFGVTGRLKASVSKLKLIQMIHSRSV